MAAPARQYSQQLLHYLRKGFTYADTGTVVTVGTLPSGAVMVKPISGVQVNVAFDGDSSNIASIGPSTDSGTNLWATSLSLTAIAFVPFDEAVSMVVSSDTIVQAAITATASATAGEGEIIIAYIPDNDQ